MVTATKRPPKKTTKRKPAPNHPKSKPAPTNNPQKRPPKRNPQQADPYSTPKNSKPKKQHSGNTTPTSYAAPSATSATTPKRTPNTKSNEPASSNAAHAAAKHNAESPPATYTKSQNVTTAPSKHATHDDEKSAQPPPKNPNNQQPHVAQPARILQIGPHAYTGFLTDITSNNKINEGTDRTSSTQGDIHQQSNHPHHMGLTMTTTTIILGNTDDKLPQTRWAAYIENITNALNEYEIHYQYTGSSDGHQPWQNYCLVINCEEEDFPKIKDDLTTIRKAYDQYSIAIITAPTEFI